MHFEEIMWKPSNWLDSALLLRKVRSEKLIISPNIILLSKNIQLKNEEIILGDYRIIPMKRHSGENLLKIKVNRSYDESDDTNWYKITSKYGTNVGLALSLIISFVMRSFAISYNGKVWPFLDDDREYKTLTGPCYLWVNCFGKMCLLNNFGGIPLGFDIHDNELMYHINEVYNILMEINEEEYLSIMGALHLYWLAYYVYLVNNSLSYSFLVASIEAISDPIYKLKYKEKFIKFIKENMPDDFFETYYSRAEIYGMDMEKHLSNVIERANKKEKPELEMKLKNYKRDRKVRQRMIKENENFQWKMEYLLKYFEKVLSNIYDARSKVFHSGRDLLSFIFKEDMFDWMPDIFEADYNEFMEDHLEHKFKYDVTPSGKIKRICSCGDRREIKFLLGIRLFETLVHKSILNYILKLEK